MKIKIGLLGIMMFAGVMMANAQGGGGGMQRRTPEEASKRVVDTLTTVFKLDQAKHDQVQTVFIDYYKTMQTAMQAEPRPDQSQREKMMAERDDKLKKVLSEEQFKKYKDEIEPAMRQRRQGGGGNQ